jgi:hypothetical protein
MKIRNPIFLPFALLLMGSVAMANHNGWSLVSTIARHTWQRAYPSTQHK